MGIIVGKFLYGSQNYNIDLPTSDKDYKYIVMPTAQDLFEEKHLNCQIDEHNSQWDIRSFFKYLKKANPNAIELLFSKEQHFYNKDIFQETCSFLQKNISSIVRLHWNDFVNALYGMAVGQMKELTPKSYARMFAYYQLCYATQKRHGNINEECFRSYNAAAKAARESNTVDLEYYNILSDKKNWQFNVQAGQEECGLSWYMENCFERLLKNSRLF